MDLDLDLRKIWILRIMMLSGLIGLPTGVSPSSRMDPYRGDAASVGIGGSVCDTMGGSAWTWVLIYYRKIVISRRIEIDLL